MPKIEIPSLPDILSMKPINIDGDSLRIAISRVVSTKVALSSRIVEITDTLQGPALSITDKALAEAERETAQLRMAIKRLDELLEGMRAELLVTEGQKTVLSLRQEGQRVAQAIAALAGWKEKEFLEIRKMIGSGFRLEDQAVALYRNYLAAAESEYRRPEVREAGAVGVALPAFPSPGPRSLFPGWG
ncbi:hypothetical protein [Acidisoma cladoniae]|jgi:PAS domain-containing protein|uniref:hypothetical protein n=1 Tax=Acidisoma cladoniae TaxID=3040935 RepID=UPI00254ED8FD|nr:hypothetical protein [Acidisoma sp. PAMC 29798]